MLDVGQAENVALGLLAMLSCPVGSTLTIPCLFGSHGGFDTGFHMQARHDSALIPDRHTFSIAA